MADSCFSQLDFVGNEAEGRISKRVFQENKARQIFRKTNISCPLIRTCTCKKYSFFRKFGVLCFLETPVLRFALLPYYGRLHFSVIVRNVSWTFHGRLSHEYNTVKVRSF